MRSLYDFSSSTRMMDLEEGAGFTGWTAEARRLAMCGRKAIRDRSQ
jgi:hypothetical protein